MHHEYFLTKHKNYNLMNFEVQMLFEDKNYKTLDYVMYIFMYYTFNCKINTRNELFLLFFCAVF